MSEKPALNEKKQNTARLSLRKIGIETHKKRNTNESIETTNKCSMGKQQTPYVLHGAHGAHYNLMFDI